MQFARERLAAHRVLHADEPARANVRTFHRAVSARVWVSLRASLCGCVCVQLCVCGCVYARELVCVCGCAHVWVWIWLCMCVGV
jgi:hypothetical protein